MENLKNTMDEILNLPSKKLDIMGEIDAYDVLFNKVENLARENKTLLGRLVRFQMADSYAVYMVVKVNKKTVVVQNIPYCDAWVDSRLGEKGSLDINYVRDRVAFEDGIHRTFNTTI